MQVTARQLRSIIGDISLQSLVENAHQHIHEAEGEVCDIILRSNQSYKLIEPVRVIPHGEAYFGGEVRGSRGRGTTAATIPAGAELMCLKPIGSKQGWFKFDALDKPIRIDINKFCSKRRDVYKSGKGIKVPPMPNASPAMHAPEGSDEETNLQSRDDVKKEIAKLRAKMEMLMDFLGEE